MITSNAEIKNEMRQSRYGLISYLFLVSQNNVYGMRAVSKFKGRAISIVVVAVDF